MKDKLNITIRIAGLDPFALEIPRLDEPNVREAEYSVNRIWKSLSARYPGKKSEEILGMTAFQIANAFVLQNKRVEETKAMLEAFESQLDKIMLDVPETDINP